MAELSWIIDRLSSHEAALVGVVLWVRMGAVLRRVKRLEQLHSPERRVTTAHAWAP